MKLGESVTYYFSDDVLIVENILRSLTQKFNFVACAIEEVNDVDLLSIDELQSSLLVHEQQINQLEKEEQTLKTLSENHFTSSRSDRGRGRGRGRNRGVRNKNDRENQQQNHHQESQLQRRGKGSGGYSSSTSNILLILSFYHIFTIRGHHSTTYISKLADKSNVECFKCQEETQQNMWYLDTGCSNHMCGENNAFYDLDESFRSSVKFDDNSKISVMGKGNVTIQTKRNFTHTIDILTKHLKFPTFQKLGMLLVVCTSKF
ncbi:hypothetical protein Lal_00027935 [Lupinus albus]|nr:hypothetical protein Lal_00027935 [Lupinus albus]